MSERDELVAQLRGWDHCWPARWLETAVADAADQIERDGREIERLRQQIAGMRAILRAGCDLLSVEADALREGISIRGELRPCPEDQNTVEAIQEIEDWIATAGTALNGESG